MSIARYPYIAIEGNIGAGKTTLAKRIAETENRIFIPEQFEDNPFLPLFYREPEKYALALELSFLEDRYRQLSSFFPSEKPVVSDYLPDKSLIFARVNLNDEELSLYERMFFHLRARLPEPDLVIYLHRETDHLKHNISKRGREYEQEIEPGYLAAIARGYGLYFERFGHCPVLWLETKGDSPERIHERVEEALEKHPQPGISWLR